MLSVHGEAIHRGDAPFLLNVSFTHDYNDKSNMVSKGILDDFNRYIFQNVNQERLKKSCHSVGLLL